MKCPQLDVYKSRFSFERWSRKHSTRIRVWACHITFCDWIFVVLALLFDNSIYVYSFFNIIYLFEGGSKRQSSVVVVERAPESSVVSPHSVACEFTRSKSRRCWHWGVMTHQWGDHTIKMIRQRRDPNKCKKKKYMNRESQKQINHANHNITNFGERASYNICLSYDK